MNTGAANTITNPIEKNGLHSGRPAAEQTGEE